MKIPEGPKLAGSTENLTLTLLEEGLSMAPVSGIIEVPKNYFEKMPLEFIEAYLRGRKCSIAPPIREDEKVIHIPYQLRTGETPNA